MNRFYKKPKDEIIITDLKGCMPTIFIIFIYLVACCILLTFPILIIPVVIVIFIYAIITTPIEGGIISNSKGGNVDIKLFEIFNIISKLKINSKCNVEIYDGKLLILLYPEKTTRKRVEISIPSINTLQVFCKNIKLDKNLIVKNDIDSIAIAIESVTKNKMILDISSVIDEYYWK